MPELPSVEDFRRECTKVVDRKISKVKIIDDYILKTPKSKFKQEIQGKQIKSVKRWGKYIFLELEGKSNALLHFGMSGSVRFYTKEIEEPEYSKIILEFEDGTFFSIISVRKFGRVELIGDYKTYVDNNEIGPDALEVSLEEFKEIMDYKKRSYAKTALMDQSALSGLGNIFSDEILFQAHIYPKTKVSKLHENKIETMFSLMKEILKKAVDRKLDKNEYPDNFIIPHRDLEDTCPICDTNIKRLEISSRHSYYCPKCQPKQN